MKRIVWASMAVVVSSVFAFAADAPVPQVYRSMPVDSWTGCYAGIQGGYARASSDSVTGHIDGGLAGGQLGCNWQTSPNWVWGIESELLWTGLKDGDPAVVELKAEWLASVRLRAGISTPAALLYVTGGVGFGDGSVTALNIEDSKTHVGWVAGGGLEWMLGNNWTGRIEYLHYDFDKKTYFGTLPLDYNVDTVKVGLSYKFSN
ncbi:MAG: outer membrane beta-barrel protein [Hyphomicrobium sp.]